MSKIKFYHTRTLLWTYLVWAVLNLLFAFLVCKPMPQLYMHPSANTDYPLARVPIVWAWLHIAPLLSLTISWSPWWHPVVATGVAGVAVVSGLLINRWWARFLIIVGMSIWFCEAMLVAGLAM